MKQNTLHPNDLSDSQKQDIKKNITSKILKKQPNIQFSGTLHDNTLEGKLTLNGQTHAIEIPLETNDTTISGKLDITPSRWGIAPFKAMAGAIKLQDKWTITFETIIN